MRRFIQNGATLFIGIMLTVAFLFFSGGGILKSLLGALILFCLFLILIKKKVPYAARPDERSEPMNGDQHQGEREKSTESLRLWQAIADSKMFKGSIIFLLEKMSSYGAFEGVSKRVPKGVRELFFLMGGGFIFGLLFAVESCIEQGGSSIGIGFIFPFIGLVIGFIIFVFIKFAEAFRGK